MAELFHNPSFLYASKGSSNSLFGEKTSQKTPILASYCVSSSRAEALRTSGFHGRKLFMGDKNVDSFTAKASPFTVKVALAFPKAAKWWEKGIQPNMAEIDSANDLVHSLRNAGDRLVVVDFFSPGCAGCRALHPKICQFAEMNPEVQFLCINYEKHKSMCYSLNVHVLPFFRFYRGAQGRVCSFSCTNATIKKFKDALAKHTPDRCGLGPAMGLEEKELLALAANKDLDFSYVPKPAVVVPSVDDVPVVAELPLPATPSRFYEEAEEKTLVAAG